MGKPSDPRNRWRRTKLGWALDVGQMTVSLAGGPPPAEWVYALYVRGEQLDAHHFARSDETAARAAALRRAAEWLRSFAACLDAGRSTWEAEEGAPTP